MIDSSNTHELVKKIGKLGAFLIFFISFSKDCTAQHHLFRVFPDSTDLLEIKYSRPDLSSPFTDMKLLAGIYEARINLGIYKKYHLNVNVPFVNAAFEEFDTDRGIGNISVGLQRILKSEDKNTSYLMLELFIPVSQNNPDFLDFGLFTNFHDFAKYIDGGLTVHVNYGHKYHAINGFYIMGEIGSSIVIDVGDSLNETEVLLSYGLAAMYDFSSFNIRAEFNGEGILTESNTDDRFYQSLSFGAQLTQGNFKPGLYYNRLLDDNLSANTNGVLGLTFAFTL